LGASYGTVSYVRKPCYQRLTLLETCPPLYTGTMERVTGRHKSGKQKVSELPRLQVRISPRCRATLTALSALQNRPMWKIVEDAVQLYLAQATQEDRRLVAGIVARAERKASP
jgi:hypothetical protein